LTHLKGNDATVSGVDISGKYGFVHTATGVYFLNSEGIGGFVEDSNLAVVDAYSAWPGGKSSGMPTVCIKMKANEVLALPVKESVNLADFIRVFGSRLESNYNTVLKELT